VLGPPNSRPTRASDKAELDRKLISACGSLATWLHVRCDVRWRACTGCSVPARHYSDIVVHGSPSMTLGPRRLDPAPRTITLSDGRTASLLAGGRPVAGSRLRPPRQPL
jgi:hypothetical protein